MPSADAIDIVCNLFTKGNLQSLLQALYNQQYTYSRTAKSRDVSEGAGVMKSDSNQREFTRIPIQLNVQVTPTQQPTTSYQVKDVSMKGVYLLCEQPLPMGTECRVTFLLGDKDSPVRIEVGGKVARVDTNGMGVEITEIVGVESFAHLRNLVLYNSPDTDQIEQEFHDHIGLKRRE